MYAPISTPDRHYNPLVPDTERHVFSAGVGRSFGRWSFDVAYQFIYGPANTVRGSTPSLAGESADGRYEFTGHALTLTSGFRF
jgi:long-chain fatty acid transport protein